jgi:hypothetical protein
MFRPLHTGEVSKVKIQPDFSHQAAFTFLFDVAGQAYSLTQRLSFQSIF